MSTSGRAPKTRESLHWTVINAVFSLLDLISEATIRIQGAGDTHDSQAMFIMTEVIVILKDESHPIRMTGTIVMPPLSDSILMEANSMSDLTTEV